MTVWYDTTAVFGSVDVVLRAVVLTAHMHVVYVVPPSANGTGTNRMTHGGQHCSLNVGSDRWDSTSYLDHLKYLNIAQLRDLLEDEESLLCTIRSSNKFQDLQKQTKVKWASNRRLAEANLSYQPYLLNNKTLLAEKYQLLGQALSSLRHKQRKLDAWHGQLRLKTTRQSLKQKAADFMNESESLWQRFLEGNLLLLDFMESFLSARKLYYRVLVQVMKMQNLSTHGPQRAEVPNIYSRDVHSATAVNMLYSLSPVVMLPSTFPPLMGHSVTTSYLPPLNHYSGAALWTPFVPFTDPGHSQEDMRVWPQRLQHLQWYKESKDSGPKP
ncbi:hypothetical protein NFI96_021661 [Prochilodus magdalenae]|nr:hypothetical protein NFI96_021661 [Prochilodus magdalenae]